MAGIAILLDLLRKNPSFFGTSAAGQSLHSHSLFSASVAASTAAIAAGGTPFIPFSFFHSGLPRVAHCDAGALSEDYISTIGRTSESTFQHDAFHYATKEYKIELKPLFSAFQWKNLAMTSLRSFLLFYLPLLESHAKMEEDDDDDDDDDFLQDDPKEHRVDLVVPFKKSVKQILRESTIVTTRRVLERLAVHYVSQRLAWKLLKDVPKSAARKAQRGWPTPVYIFCVSRTTFRGHFLGILASWLVQVGIDVYRFFSSIFSSKEEVDKVDKEEQLQVLGRKAYIATLRCGASLVFASVGAGIGATLFRPSTGQWIGCAIGDLMGPLFVSFCFKIVLHADL